MLDFTVVIPSRNRPVLLRQAIDSVLAQTHPHVDIIVVDDGTDETHAPAYAALAAELAGRVRFHALPRTPGHGQSYAINTGAAQSGAAYVTSLDDDDYWTDPDHLARAARIIEAAGGSADVYLANQHAFHSDGARRTGHVWIEGLLEQAGRPLSPGAHGAYEVTADDFMRCSGFGHLNTTITRRGHYEAIGGLDPNIRYECDRDFFLRVTDTASLILYVPDVVSHHNIPDPAAKNSISTAISSLGRHLDQLRVLDKAILYARHASVRAHGRRHKAYALKKIAALMNETGARREAAYYAAEAAFIGFNPGWLAYAAWLRLRAIGG